MSEENHQAVIFPSEIEMRNGMRGEGTRKESFMRLSRSPRIFLPLRPTPPPDPAPTKPKGRASIGRNFLLIKNYAFRKVFIDKISKNQLKRSLPIYTWTSNCCTTIC